MRKIVLLVFTLLLSLNLLAGKRFLIETEKSIANVSLIDTKIGKTIELMPLLNGKTFFSFEVDDIESIFLEFSNNIKVKLYSFSDKKGTSWHPVEKDKKLSVKSLFSSSSAVNMEFDTFITTDFISNPITNTGGSTRGNRIFYTPDNTSFSKPNNLLISWKSNEKVTSLKLYSLNGFKEIFATQTFQDTVFEYRNIPEECRNKLKLNETYSLSINTVNGDFGIHESEIIFKFDALSFNNASKDLIFANDQNIEIKWDAPDKETLIKVYDENKNIVYQNITSNKSWSLNEQNNIPIKYNKPYLIELSQDGKSISKNFYVLFSSEEYKLLKR